MTSPLELPGPLPIPAGAFDAAAAPGVRCSGACNGCALREICSPHASQGIAGTNSGIASGSGNHAPRDSGKSPGLVYARRKFKRGQSVYLARDPFTALYAVRSGSFKMKLTLDDGREQVMDFVMPGEIMGMDGIAADRHTTDVIALEESEICAVPFPGLLDAAGRAPGLQHRLHRLMSMALVREQNVMILLGTMRAEEKLATFLLNLSSRFAARGFSSSEFNLRMTREEIGSYLGLKLETVSRLFSRFQALGLVEVQLRHIRILDLPGLKAVVDAVPMLPKAAAA